MPFSTLKKFLQADQEVAPLRAAVVHEFAFLAPPAMLEQQNRFAGFRADLKHQVRIKPFLGSIDALERRSFLR